MRQQINDLKLQLLNNSTDHSKDIQESKKLQDQLKEARKLIEHKEKQVTIFKSNKLH
jgi:hypothetical protein